MYESACKRLKSWDLAQYLEGHEFYVTFALNPKISFVDTMGTPKTTHTNPKAKTEDMR